MALNYVKFQRGSAEAFARLKARNALENDALYFIYDKDKPEEGGLLYLGDVLIGGTGLIGATALNELSDVDTQNVPIIDGMILQYNNNLKIWKPISIKTAIERSGARLGNDSGKALPGVYVITTEDGQSMQDALDNFSVTPVEGDIVFVDNNSYIYDGSQWRFLTGESIEDRLSLLENGLQEINGRLDSSNFLTSIIQETIPIVTESSKRELENKIIFVPKGDSESDDNQYDEYMIIDDQLEKLGTWSANLANYVQVGDLHNYVQQSQLQDYVTKVYVDSVFAPNSKVGDLRKLLHATGQSSTTVVDEVVNIYNRLQWHQIMEGD